MLEFKDLTLDDKGLIDTYIKSSKFLTCEYSFITLYIWRKAWSIQFCIYKEALIIKKTTPEFGTFFMQPIGYKPDELSEIIEILIEYKNNHGMDFLFRNLEEPFLEELVRVSKDAFIIAKEENNFDYIYESHNLINLSGRKLSSKRNHFTRFVNSYNYKVEEITLENTERCVEASREWCVENSCTGLLAYEQESIMDMLHNHDILNFYGIVVYVDDKISAFTIGEKVNEDMVIIHTEKAFSDVHGLYTFINRTFVEKYFKDVKFINREDDMGLEGLRKAKQSYQPYKLEYKYTVALKN